MRGVKHICPSGFEERNCYIDPNNYRPEVTFLDFASSTLVNEHFKNYLPLRKLYLLEVNMHGFLRKRSTCLHKPA